MNIRCALPSILLVAACNAPGAPADAGPDGDAGIESLPLTLVVPTPTGERAVTTIGDRVTLAGLAWGPVEHVGYAIAGGAAGDLAGTERWSGEVAVAPGESTITITATGGGAQDAESLTLIRNAQIEIASPLEVEPDVLLVDQPAVVVARIALLGPVDPARVTLMRVDGAGAGTPVAAMRDDGIAPDLTAGDRFYTARFTVDESAPVRFDLVVEATPTGAASPDRSPRHRFAVYAPPRAEDVAARDAMIFRAYRTFAAHFTDEPSRSNAIDAVVADLRGQPDVRAAERAAFTVTFHLASGQVGHAELAPPGTLGGGIDPTSPECRRALLVAPFYFDFVAVTGEESSSLLNVQDRLLQAANRCRRHIDVDVRRTTAADDLGAAGLDDFADLKTRDLLFIDTHGSVHSDSTAAGITRTEYLIVPLVYCGPGEVPAAQCPVPPELMKELTELAEDERIMHQPDFIDFNSDVMGSAGRHTVYTARLLPSFFAKRGPYEGTVVVVNACHSFQFGDLADAFLSAGAAAYLGWSDYVHISETAKVMDPLFECLTSPDRQVGECYAEVKGLPHPRLAQLAYRRIVDDDVTVCERP